jgi:hypothetical protein
MKNKPLLEQQLQQQSLSPQERLTKSRAEIVKQMESDNNIFHVLQPVVVGYAKSNPMKTLGIVASLGAVMVVLKPWRLITLGSLLAVLKARM